MPRGCALRPVRATVGRHAVTGALTETLHSVGSEDRAADQDLVYEAGVVVTELLSNATHACRSRIALRLEVHHGSIRIEVHDDGPGVPVERRVRGDEVGGRGLRIVDSLSTSWGTIPRPAGKVRLVRDAGRQHVDGVPGLHLPPSLTVPAAGDRPRVPGLRNGPAT